VRKNKHYLFSLVAYKLNENVKFSDFCRANGNKTDDIGSTVGKTCAQTSTKAESFFYP